MLKTLEMVDSFSVGYVLYAEFIHSYLTCIIFDSRYNVQFFHILIVVVYNGDIYHIWQLCSNPSI